MPAKPSVAVAIVLVVGIGSCGGGDDGGEPPLPPPPPPPETRHRVPELPPRWKVHVNRAGGFVLGVPPGWRARDRLDTTLVRSFDRLTAVSIVPDRNPDAAALPLADFATRAFAALAGFTEEPEPGRERQFEHRYNALELRARARAEQSGIRQRVRLIILRRARHVTFTVVIASHLRRGGASERVAERMVRTLRSRPVGRGLRGQSGG